jgi:hypothetical protein
VCSRLPGITIHVEPNEADHLEKARAAVAEESELWRRQQRMADRPIISLHAATLESNGEETTDTMDIDAIRTALREARRIALEPRGVPASISRCRLPTEIR